VGEYGDPPFLAAPYDPAAKGIVVERAEGDLDRTDREEG
jgi:hypothetical protein